MLIFQYVEHIYGNNDFTEISKNIVRYRFENNFVRPSTGYWNVKTFCSIAHHA